MTALRPYNRWRSPYDFSYFQDSWFKLRAFLFKKVLTRQFSMTRDQYEDTGGFYIYNSDWYDFIEDYWDISIASSFITAEENEDSTLAYEEYLSGVQEAVLIEHRHLWICGASDLKKFESGFWRSTHFSRLTNNPRLFELVDSV